MNENRATRSQTAAGTGVGSEASNISNVGGTERPTTTATTGLAGEVHQERERTEHVPVERMDQSTGFGSRGTRT